MSEDRELRELKDKLNQLEAKVDSLKKSGSERSSAANFLIAFLLVFVALIISIGIFQYVAH